MYVSVFVYAWDNVCQSNIQYQELSLSTPNIDIVNQLKTFLTVCGYLFFILFI